MVRSTATRIAMLLCLLVLVLGMGAGSLPVVHAGVAPDIRLMVPGRNEVFPYEDGYVVIRLFGTFTNDTEVVLQVFDNANPGIVPPQSQPTDQLATITSLENNSLKVAIPLSEWIQTYGPTSRTLSAVVTTNSSGTDSYYFSVVKNISNPAYYRGGLP